MEQMRRVLVIDDQLSIHEDFKKILGAKPVDVQSLADARSAFLGQEAPAADREYEFELTFANQGNEGVRLFREAVDQGEPFGMAFVDVRMPPGIDGVQTIKAIWELDPDVQVVICTAFSDYSFEQIVDELGTTDRLLILKKPFDPVEVRQLAAALTEKRLIAQTVRVQMEELHAAHEQAREASRAKSEFLANMSHEIRTPMNAILGYVDLVCDPQASEEERAKYAKTIRTSSNHLLTILNDILDLSRIEACRLVIDSADFSPFELAREVASMTVAQASEKDLELVIEVPRPIPEKIESDLTRVRQVLLNLVSNAIKFTDSGTVKLVLRLDDLDESDHRYLCFDVVDTGIGIPRQKLESIFDPFSQADGSYTRRFGGTGLGLTISKRLALMLGGDIEVESRMGQGSRFTLRLYAGKIGRAALREYTPVECANFHHGKRKAVEAAPLNGRILLVEDVVLNRRLMKAILNKVGAEVTEAQHGRDGLEKGLQALQDGRPYDLVLMDMQMPVMDGYEATEKLRAAGHTGPILALTAHAMTGDREKCLEAGCDDYTTKPVDRQELIELCREMMVASRPAAALPSDEVERADAPVDDEA